MMAVHKLLCDHYKVDKKVVFQNKVTRISSLTVMAART
jgi:hypothetical protein